LGWPFSFLREIKRSQPSAAPTPAYVGAAEGCDLLIFFSQHFRKAKKTAQNRRLKGKFGQLFSE
jgi:hypothetical protein